MSKPRPREIEARAQREAQYLSDQAAIRKRDRGELERMTASAAKKRGKLRKKKALPGVE